MQSVKYLRHFLRHSVGFSNYLEARNEFNEKQLLKFTCSRVYVHAYAYVCMHDGSNFSIYYKSSFSHMYLSYDFVHSAMLHSVGYFQGHILGKG